MAIEAAGKAAAIACAGVGPDQEFELVDLDALDAERAVRTPA